MTKTIKTPGELVAEYQKALADAEKYNDLHKNIPLNRVAALERQFRKEFLDDESLAREADAFFREYASRYPFILTQDARSLLSHLAGRNSRLLVTEVSIPKTVNILHHRTEIDFASFYDAPETIRFFEFCLRPYEMSHLCPPRQKG